MTGIKNERLVHKHLKGNKAMIKTGLNPCPSHTFLALVGVLLLFGCAHAERSLDAGGQASSITRKDLNKNLARYKDITSWHYGERKTGELVGAWISDDGDRYKIVFGEDGSFSEGREGQMTTGLYAISDGGLIVTCSARQGGPTLGSWFQLQPDSKTVTGPKGPRPRVVWKRVGPPSDTR